MAGAASAVEDSAGSIAESFQTIADASATAVDSTAAVADAATASAEAVSSAVDIQVAAYAQLAEATLENAVAQKQASNAVAEYLKGELPAAVATTVLAEAQMRAAASSEQLAMAKKNLADVTAYVTTASTEEASVEMLDTESKLGNTAATTTLAAATTTLAATEEGEIAVTRGGLSARMAAGAEMRVLEGNTMGSTRAAAAFLTTSLGLGSVLQYAFPVFGAIALGEVLIDIGGKAVDLYEKFFTLKEESEELADGMAKNGEAIATAWGTTLSTLHAVGMRDNPLGTLRTDAADAATTLQYLQISLGQAKEALYSYQEIKASGNYLGHDTSEDENDERIAGNQSNVDKIKAQITEQQAKITDLNSQVAQKEKETDKPVKLAKGADPDVAKLRALEATLTAEKVDHEVSASEEEAYWGQYLATFKQGTSEYTAVAEKYISARQRVSESFIRGMREDAESANREREANAEISKSLAETQKQIDEATKQSAAQTEKTALSKSEGNIQSEKMQENLQLETIRAGEAEGGLTAYQASVQTTQVRVAALNKELGELGNQLGIVDANATLSDAEAAEKKQPITNKMADVSGQIGDVTTQGNAASAKALSQPYLTAFNDINQGFLQVQQKMILGTQSISRDFANMGAQLVVSVAAAFEKMLVKSVEFEIKSLAANQAKNAATITSNTQAASIGDAISAKSAITQIGHEASVAAAKVWAALAGIPIVGPVLGAAGAAATYAAVLALAAFETGGIVPNTGAALVHQGEAVLPTQLTGFLMHAASNYSSSSSAAQTNNFYGSSDRQFRNQMTRNATHTLRTVQRGLRAAGRA
jgi:septal ring factor EnvC (AmiA/AmiB activator)